MMYFVGHNLTKTIIAKPQ